MKATSAGAELQECLSELMEHYDRHRPHSALGGISPMQFIERLEVAKIQVTIATL